MREFLKKTMRYTVVLLSMVLAGPVCHAQIVKGLDVQIPSVPDFIRRLPKGPDMRIQSVPELMARLPKGLDVPIPTQKGGLRKRTHLQSYDFAIRMIGDASPLCALPFVRSFFRQFSC